MYPKKLIPFLRTFLCFYLILLFSELLVRLKTAVSFSGEGLLFMPLMLIPTAAFSALLSGICSKKANRIIGTLQLLFAALIYGSQLIYHTLFRTWYTVFSMLNGGQVLGFFEVIVRTVWDEFPAILLLMLPVVLFAVFSGRIVPEKPEKADIPKKLILCGAVHILCLLVLLTGGTGQFSPFDLYFKTVNTNFSMEKLGILTTMRVDLGREITGFEEDSAAPLTPALPNDTTGKNAFDIDFAALAASEKDPDISRLHSYAASVPASCKNEMTGIFEDCNLIYIVAESFSGYAVDEKLTPTLYRLKNEGICFSDFYTPLWGVSTLDGEYTTLMSRFPAEGTWSMWDTADDHLPFTYGNMFSQAGYSVYAWHNNDYDYYHRDQSHPNLGYDYRGIGGGLELETPTSDSEMIDVTTDIYLSGDGPFHVYYLTMAGHMLYDFETNEMAARYRSLVEGLPYDEDLKAYLACQIELDRAVELLLQRLDEAGKLENTVIAISSDHYPYVFSAEKLSQLAGEEIDPDFGVYKNDCIIYRPGMEPVKVDEPCCSADILPTLLNMFGMDFDSRLFVGRDVFSDAEPLVVMQNHSFITSEGRYNTRTGETDLPEDTARLMLDRINNMFDFSRKSLKYDYYRVLDQHLRRNYGQ